MLLYFLLMIFGGNLLYSAFVCFLLGILLMGFWNKYVKVPHPKCPKDIPVVCFLPKFSSEKVLSIGNPVFSGDKDIPKGHT